MQNQKKTKGMAASKQDRFNAYWSTNLINNVEAKEKKSMHAQTKRTDMQAETTVTFHSCMSLNEQE